MTENIIIIEPGDERAKKIAKAMSSKTANDILHLMKNGGHTATELADQMNLPLTTVQYHLENLVDANVLDVIDKRWSKKGREVKVYGLRNQLLIVTPDTTNVKSLLLKYASLFVIVVLASAVMMVVFSTIAPLSAPPFTMEKADQGAIRIDSTLAPIPWSNFFSSPAAIFLFGGCIGILGLIIYDIISIYWSRR